MHSGAGEPGDGEKGPVKECRQLLEAGKGQEDLLMETPAGAQPCWHLDFSVLRPIVNLWPPEL